MRLILILFITSLMLGVLGVSWMMNNAGQFKQLEEVDVAACTPVQGAVGAEDLTIHPAGFAFISAVDRRALAKGDDAQGGIYFYDMRGNEAELDRLESDFSGVFRPHGLSLYRGSDGLYLHVVNHPPSGHSVEIFKFEDRRLFHLETVTGAEFISPNDLVAVGPRSFYVTNDHTRPAGISRIVDDYLQRPGSNVVFFDGNGLRQVADGIAFANGINISQGGRELYVAATTGQRIHFYVRDGMSGDLTPNGTLEVGTGVDNIELDRHGMMWIGAHPKLLSFIQHSNNPSKLSPSQVLWVDPDQSLDPPIRTAWLDVGDTLSGSSVAGVWGSRLLVGSVFEDHFLDCERDPDAVRLRALSESPSAAPAAPEGAEDGEAGRQ